MFLFSVMFVFFMIYFICFGNVCGYNFYFILIVSGFLYGGIVGLILVVIFVVYEWLLKGMSFFLVLEVIFLLIVLLFLLKKWFFFLRDKKLILVFMILLFYVFVFLVLGMINVFLEIGFILYIL